MRHTLVAVAVLATTLAGCAVGRSALRASPLVGTPVDVVAPALDGEAVDVGSAAGTVRVVDFWATWCDPCRDQLPVLDLLARSHADGAVQIYGVSVDEDLAQLRAFLAAHPVAIRVLWDKGAARHAERLDIQRLPTTLVVDRRGVVRFVHQGFDPAGAAALDREVTALLAEPP